jgi:5-enolpyruvylshikimate-3-phosphate synthase
MDSNECRTLIPAARSAAGRPFAEVLDAIDAAGAQFSANAQEQFGRKGEW